MTRFRFASPPGILLVETMPFISLFQKTISEELRRFRFISAPCGSIAGSADKNIHNGENFSWAEISGQLFELDFSARSTGLKNLLQTQEKFLAELKKLTGRLETKTVVTLKTSS